MFQQRPPFNSTKLVILAFTLIVVVVTANIEGVSSSVTFPPFSTPSLPSIFTSVAPLLIARSSRIFRLLVFLTAAEELDVRLFRRDDAMCVLIDCDGFKANHFHPFDYSSNATASRDVGGWVSSVMVYSARWFEDAKEFGVEIFAV